MRKSQRLLWNLFRGFWSLQGHVWDEQPGPWRDSLQYVVDVLLERRVKPGEWESFDGFLLKLALEQGARHISDRVDAVTWDEGRPRVKTKAGVEKTYDFLVAATGVNTAALKLFQDLEV